MSITANYETEAICGFGSNRVTCYGPLVKQTLSDKGLIAQVRAALAQPIDYPSLASAIVPGDCVAISLEYGIPCPLQVCMGALYALHEGGAEPSRVTLLLDHSFLRDRQLLESLRELAAREGCRAAIHDPDDEHKNSLLGVTRAGRALRLNRLLCDADYVLSIGASFIEPATEGPGPSFGGLFPVFSDRETIDRYSAPIAADSRVIRSERHTEIDEAGWLLGLGLTLQVVPGAPMGVAAVVAGDPATIAKQAEKAFRELWSCQVEKRGDLAIATIAGDRSQQDWPSIGRALAAAERVVEEGGAIVIYSELDQLPGPSLRRLAGSDDYRQVERALMRDRFPESSTAVRLGRALQSRSVYLRSQLAANVVERLGLAPISDEEELARLINAHKHCLVLKHANRLLVSLD